MLALFFTTSQKVAFRASCLQCFDAVAWVAGRASGLLKTDWWGAGMVICLGRGAHLHMVHHMPLPLTVTHTHTHNHFTALLEYVRDHPGEQVPER